MFFLKNIGNSMLVGFLYIDVSEIFHPWDVLLLYLHLLCTHIRMEGHEATWGWMVFQLCQSFWLFFKNQNRPIFLVEDGTSF